MWIIDRKSEEFSKTSSNSIESWAKRQRIIAVWMYKFISWVVIFLRLWSFSCYTFLRIYTFMWIVVVFPSFSLSFLYFPIMNREWISQSCLLTDPLTHHTIIALIQQPIENYMITIIYQNSCPLCSVTPILSCSMPFLTCHGGLSRG